MASNDYILNTWYAKRIIGDAGATNDALLQLTNNNTLILSNERTTLYGIKYNYDTTEDENQINNGHDKIEIYGGNPSVLTAWIQLDTGDLYVLGNVGIGHDPDTHKLYVNGTSYFTNTITFNNGPINGKVIEIIGTDDKVFSFKLSGTPAASNVDIGWDWTNIEGAGAAFRSTSFSTQEGEFRIYARKKDSNDEAVCTQLIGTPGDTDKNGVLSWSGKVDIGITSTTPTSQLTVTGPNSGSLPLVKLNPSGTANWQRGVQMLNSGMVQGTQLMYCVGQADSSKNMGQMYFYYNASGDNANRLSFGLHSVDDAFNITGAGYITSGDTVQFSNTTSWKKGTMIVGANGSDKIIIGYLNSSTNGAVVGAHASACTAWAPLYLAGTQLYIRGSETTWAKWIDGCLSLFPTSTNYREGLRIHSASNWSDITLCGNDLTEDSGISANSWFIGNNNGNFYIARNGSPGTTAYLSCVSNVWNFLNQVTFGARVTSTAPSALTNVDRIVITPYYHTGGPWKITSRDDASNAYLSLYYSTTETARMQHNGALLLCNNISFTNSGTAFRGINYGTMGDNDQWRIGGAATAANAGYMELATADDGNEPIYIRQYTGTFATVKRTLTLLDANGNSGFPGNITCVGAPQTVTAANMAFNGGVQLREVGAVGNAQSAIEYGPRLSFHWSNRVAKSITLHSNGTFYFRDQNGTSRSMIDANVTGNLTGNADSATYLKDRTNSTASYLNYGASGLAGSAISWMCCWNGYEVRAISKAETFNVVRDNGGDSRWVNVTGDTMTGALTVTSTGSNRANVNIRSATAVPMDLYLGSNNTNYWSISCRESTDPWLGFYWAGSSAGWALTMRTNRHIEIPVHAYVGGYNNTSYSLSTASFICQSWIRTTGSTGWYNETYGGGWYMTDSTWIRSYNNKSVYVNTGDLRCDGSTWGGMVRMTSNWLGFYSANGGGTRYGYIQANANRMYFRKENGVSTYHFDMDGGYLYTSRCYNAVWNDYAECRNTATEEPGRCVMESITGQMQLTTSRLQSGCKIISDTYGTCIGATEEIKTPIAVSGRVLAYPYRNREEYPLGAAVCSAPNGTIDIMTRDEIMMYPERIVGTVSEIPNYEIWHCGSKELKEEIQVNGRIWIYVR